MQCMQSRSESSHGKLNSLDMSRTVPLLHFAIHGFFSLGMHCSASAQLVAVSTSTIDSSAILLEPRPLCTTFYSYLISSTADEVAEWLSDGLLIHCALHAWVRIPSSSFIFYIISACRRSVL